MSLGPLGSVSFILMTVGVGETLLLKWSELYKSIYRERQKNPLLLFQKRNIFPVGEDSLSPYSLSPAVPEP